MKTFFLTFAFGFLLLNTTFAQKISIESVPVSVIKTFHTMFALAEKSDWEMQYENYGVEFKLAKADISAVFDKDGKWLETQTYMKPSELPKPLKDQLVKEFGELSGYKIDDAQKIESLDKGVEYVLDVEKGELNYEMTFSEAGTLINKQNVIDKNSDKD